MTNEELLLLDASLRSAATQAGKPLFTQVLPFEVHELIDDNLTAINKEVDRIKVVLKKIYPDLATKNMTFEELKAYGEGKKAMAAESRYKPIYFDNKPKLKGYAVSGFELFFLKKFYPDNKPKDIKQK